MDVEPYLPLVRAIARHYQKKLPPTIEYGDLCGDGYVGLVRASQVFDESLGVPFKCYARQWINWSINDGLRRMDCLSRHDRRYHPMDVYHVSLSWHPTAADSVIAHRNSAHEVDRQCEAELALRRVSVRQARILRSYYWDGMSLRAIARDLRRHETGVGEQFHRALDRLRAAMEA